MKAILLLFFFFSLLQSNAQNLDWVNVYTDGQFGNNVEMEIADNSIFLLGNFNGNIDFSLETNEALLESGATADLFLARFSLDGELLWINQLLISNEVNHLVKALGMSSTANGTILLCGSFRGILDFDGSPELSLNSVSSTSGFFAAINQNGDFLFTYKIEAGNELEIQDIQEDNNGNILLCGAFNETIDIDPGPAAFELSVLGDPFKKDIVIAMYSPDIELLWAKQIGSDQNDKAQASHFLSDDSFAITGYFGGSVDFDPDGNSTMLSSLDNNDVFIARYENNGTLLWAGQLGGDSGLSQADQSNALLIDELDNIFIGGVFRGDMDIDWTVGEEFLEATGNSDAFVISYNKEGVVNWGNCICGNDFEAIYDLSFQGNNIYAIGHFGAVVDFDPGQEAYWLSSNGEEDIFFAAYNKNTATFVQALQIGGASSFNDSGRAIAIDQNENIYVAGGFYGEVDFDPASTEALFDAMDDRALFFAKYGEQVSTQFWKHSKEIIVYPNPTTGFIYWDTATSMDNIKLYSHCGKFYQEYNNIASLNLTALPSGVYTLELTGDNFTSFQKIIKIE